MPKYVTAKEKMCRAKAALHHAHPNDSLAEILGRDREAFSGLRLLFASDVAGADISHLLPANDPNIAVMGVFCTQKFLTFSDEAEQAMRRGGTYRYSLAARTILDTNFLSELPLFFEGKEVKESAKIADTLSFIKTRLNGSFEWAFAGMENLRQAVRENNPFPYRKVAAAKYFDETGAITPRHTGFSVRDPELDTFFTGAEDFWSAIMSNPASWDALRWRDTVYCLTLKAMLERWSGSSVEDGLRNLVQFCLDDLEMLPLKEIYFAWKALRPNGRLSILDEKRFLSPHDKSIKRINSLSWDLFLFRWIEKILSDRERADFHLPLVTTLDRNLVAAIQDCPLRAVLIHDEAGLVESIFDDSRAFNVCLDAAITPAQRERIFDSNRQIGRAARRPSLLQDCIYQLEEGVRELVHKAGKSKSQ